MMVIPHAVGAALFFLGEEGYSRKKKKKKMPWRALCAVGFPPNTTAINQHI